jgi:hypothetical protein
MSFFTRRELPRRESRATRAPTIESVRPTGYFGLRETIRELTVTGRVSLDAADRRDYRVSLISGNSRQFVVLRGRLRGVTSPNRGRMSLAPTPALMALASYQERPMLKFNPVNETDEPRKFDIQSLCHRWCSINRAMYHE